LSTYREYHSKYRCFSSLLFCVGAVAFFLTVYKISNDFCNTLHSAVIRSCMSDLNQYAVASSLALFFIGVVTFSYRAYRDWVCLDYLTKHEDY
jgi:hypothetical protein